MGLLDRINAARAGDEKRYSTDQWISDYLVPAFSYNGTFYSPGGSLTQTLAGNRASEISATLPGYAAALQGCPPAFAAEMVRALVLSQARFTFRNNALSRTPRRLFGTSELGILEKPWPNGTTGELIARMEWHAGLAGNAYVVRRPDRLRVLRPDWCALVYGSHQEPDDAAYALDGELIGLVYQNGGLHKSGNKMQTILVGDFAHWSPMPDPLNAGIGMSWITPAVRDIQGDRLATDHKIKFFENGATPSMVVKGITATTKQQFDDIVEMLEADHAGVANAYRTLYLTAGADATVVGADLKQIDFKATQGAGETRIASLSRVPAPLLGISEGLAGSSLNAGNFGMARRMFADTWVYPSLQDLSASLSPIIKVPRDAELWFDTGDMPILREDAKDSAEIEQVKGATINAYLREGWTAESAKAAVIAGDVSLLVHSGMVSVQLQAPGTTTGSPGDAFPKADPSTRSAEGDDDLDEESLALLIALTELADEDARAFTPGKHPRNPKGTPGGGRFRSLVDRIKDAIEEHAKGDGDGDPLGGFNREQLRKVAAKQGIALKRGEPIESIKAKLLERHGGGAEGKGKVPSKPVADAKPESKPEAKLKSKPDAPERPSVTKKASRAPVDVSQITSPDLSDEDRLRLSKELMEGAYAGIEVRVRWATDSPSYSVEESRSVSIEADLFDKQGAFIGSTQRVFEDFDDDGFTRQIVHHAYLRIDAKHQSQGFAKEFNQHLEGSYRHSGIEEIHLDANIDVGGYAWARQGYDWADEAAAKKIKLRIEDQIKAYTGRPHSMRTIADARDLLDRMESEGFGGDFYPTPYELSELGRWDGATRDDTWFGKDVLLGSYWKAVKPL